MPSRAPRLALVLATSFFHGSALTLSLLFCEFWGARGQVDLWVLGQVDPQKGGAREEERQRPKHQGRRRTHASAAMSAARAAFASVRRAASSASSAASKRNMSSAHSYEEEVGAYRNAASFRNLRTLPVALCATPALCSGQCCVGVCSTPEVRDPRSAAEMNKWKNITYVVVPGCVALFAYSFSKSHAHGHGEKIVRTPRGQRSSCCVPIAYRCSAFSI